MQFRETLLIHTNKQSPQGECLSLSWLRLKEGKVMFESLVSFF